MADEAAAARSDTSSPPPPEFGIFDEPSDYYPPTPPPTSQTYTLSTTGEVLTLHLVGYSSLEAHQLWQGGRVIASFFEENAESLVKGKTILELGAGAGLPSLICGILGAEKVVMTDYPEPDIVQTMWKNVSCCEVLKQNQKQGGEEVEEEDEDKMTVVVDGLIWGADPGKVLSRLDAVGEKKEKGGRKFDGVILADLLFRHGEHGNMLKSVEDTMRRREGSRAYVFFTSYRPWLRHKDLAFFDLAREKGFLVEKVLEKMMEKPLYENDPGDEEIRRTVTGFTLRWPEGCWDEE